MLMQLFSGALLRSRRLVLSFVVAWCFMLRVQGELWPLECDGFGELGFHSRVLLDGDTASIGKVLVEIQKIVVPKSRVSIRR